MLPVGKVIIIFLSSDPWELDGPCWCNSGMHVIGVVIFEISTFKYQSWKLLNKEQGKNIYHECSEPWAWEQWTSGRIAGKPWTLVQVRKWASGCGCGKPQAWVQWSTGMSAMSFGHGFRLVSDMSTVSLGWEYRNPGISGHWASRSF